MKASKMNVLTNLLFVLTDVIETNLMDMEQEYAKNRMVFRQDMKRNYNKAIHAIKCIKDEVAKCSQVTQNDYGNDADTLNAVILTMIDRVGDDDMMLFRIYEYIKSMPSKLELGFDLDDAFSYLFEKK